MTPRERADVLGTLFAAIVLLSCVGLLVLAAVNQEAAIPVRLVEGRGRCECGR